MCSRAAQLPQKALKAAAREFKRLKKMSPQVRTFKSERDCYKCSQMPEYPMLRHYLELVTELPWNKVFVGLILNLSFFSIAVK